MAIPVKHFITFGPNAVPVYQGGHAKPAGTSPYTHIVWCSCQWQGLATSVEHARQLMYGHAGTQHARGNLVESKDGVSGLVTSSSATGQGDPNSTEASTPAETNTLAQFRSNKMDPGLPGHPKPSPTEMEGFKP